MSASGRKLTRKQEAVIAALIGERTHADAAARAGISEATLQRWLRLPNFQTAYREARRRVLDDAIEQIQAAAGAAVETLRRNLHCGRPGDENRAALGLLDHALRARELVEIEDRLAALEAAAACRRQTERNSYAPHHPAS